ncbi:DUF1493 family protein [Xenorhabdus sp. XENO-10]|uniref:DUF1493 family protein n=1 Tax=Xenorhabdus yunnanensis TaxID=3025878 RepID=A0ABT5LI01_9GAMM|nr:DUF1493 family protein [Xenorhabdus yunnanensis]MDC9590738.1 DUF1493 family protein [Xenorhabdus yunnanensis]
MVDRTNIEHEVLAWYEVKYHGPVYPFPCFKTPKLTLETSLSTGKYPWSWEDAEDILAEYFEKFEVEQRHFTFLKYWPNEEVLIPLNFLRRKENRIKYIEPAPLTMAMLVNSAKAGYWLYD